MVCLVWAPLILPANSNRSVHGGRFAGPLSVGVGPRESASCLHSRFAASSRKRGTLRVPLRGLSTLRFDLPERVARRNQGRRTPYGVGAKTTGHFKPL